MLKALVHSLPNPISESARVASKAAIREMSANLLALNLYPFGVFHGRERKVDYSLGTPNSRPILLVHGVVHNPSAFIPLKKYLIRRGFKNIFTVNYRTTHGRLTQMVEDVERRAQEVAALTGKDQIDIVAHSLGGLVARHYLSFGAGRGTVRKLVTLGTPHQGTRAATLLQPLISGSLARDLRAESKVVGDLSRAVIDRRSEVFSISSKFDHTVWPQSHAEAIGRPASAFHNISVETTGHMGLLYSREVLAHVMKCLKDA